MEVLGLPLKNSLILRILFLSFLVLVVDQITKAAALRFLALVPTLPVAPDLFHLTLVLNSGVAFGFFRGYGLAVGAATLFLLMALWISSSQKDSGTALALILGGAVGNLIDRIRFGAVVDFLDFRVWPVFNVADSCITIGAVLMAWTLLRRR